jgi:Amt family ammonium transporter
VFNSPSLGGPGYVSDWVTGKVITAAEYSISSQLWIQFKGVATTFIWSAVVAFIAYKLVDLTIGLRVPEEEEREGLDTTSHGEAAYRM